CSSTAARFCAFFILRSTKEIGRYQLGRFFRMARTNKFIKIRKEALLKSFDWSSIGRNSTLQPSLLVKGIFNLTLFQLVEWIFSYLFNSWGCCSVKSFS